MTTFQGLIKTIAYRCGFSLRRLRMPKSFGVDSHHQGAVRPLLHAVSPYEGLETSSYPDDLHGWGGESPAFRELIEEIEPARIIEVGTWKGASAINMAQQVKQHDHSCEILCVDTWLGALEMWTDLEDSERHGSLRLKNGYPTVYYTFLSNVLRAGLEDIITPFPVPSITAAQWCALHGVRAGMIYIDGSHEEEDVYQDLITWWDLVLPGGVLFGDDWTWDGVRLAVQRFVRENRLNITHQHDKWVIHRIK